MSKQTGETGRNLLFGLWNQAVLLVVSYLVRRAVFLALGGEYLGLLTVFANAGDLLVFAYSGIGMVLTNRLYGALAHGDDERTAQIFRWFDRFFGRFTLGTACVAVLAAYPVWLCVDVGLPAARVMLFYGLFQAGTLIYNRYLVHFYCLMAAQKRYVGCIIQSILELAATAVQLWAVYVCRDFVLFLVCGVVKYALVSLLTKIYAGKEMPCLKEKTEAESGLDEKRTYRDIRDVIVARTGDTIVTSTDFILVSAIVGTAVSGYYGNYRYVSGGILTISNAVFLSLMARLGHNIVQKSKEGQFEDYRRITLLNLLLSITAATGYYLLCNEFIELWVGTDSLLTERTLMLLTLSAYMGMMRQGSQTFRISAGLFSKISSLLLFRGLLNLVLSIIMGKLWGVDGIVAATIVAGGVTVYWYEPKLVLSYLGKKYWFEVFYQAAGLALTVFCIFICEKAVHLLPGAGAVHIFLEGMIIVGICVLAFALAAVIYFLCGKIGRRKSIEN